MRIGILTKEYAPYIYGGAGVHVQSLVGQFIKKNKVELRCFGDQKIFKKNLIVNGYSSSSVIKTEIDQFKKIFEALEISLNMAAKKMNVDILHCHTWYTAYAGFLMKKLYNLPLVVTMHSIETLRPWKREQLDTGYDVSCWMEKLAVEHADRVIAVSDDMKINLLRCYNLSPSKVNVIYNGINADVFKKVNSTKILKKYHIPENKPYILFVGRITRQKGLIYLLQAFKNIHKDVHLVICAGGPDEKIIYKEITQEIKKLKNKGRKIIHIESFLRPYELKEIYSHAKVFVCPSIYEPFGIINLEAMACEVPVVASAVGGIPEVVIPEETGILVGFKSVSEIDHSPRNPANYAYRLAEAINYILKNPNKAKQMGAKGRKVVLKNFTWQAIAQKTLALYKQTINSYAKKN